MDLPKVSTERPVTVMMFVAGVLIFGTVSLMLLPQELFPQITYPQLTVATSYANAAPEEIETLITKPIEEAVGTVAGVKKVRSISKEGISLVIAEFGWSQNINFAALGMREKIDLIKERLPRDAEEPVVLAYNPFDRPIIILSITSSKEDRSPISLRNLSKKMIKDEVEKVEGVASANISGGLEREILVDINQDKLKSRSVSLLDVSKSISSANLNYPAGTIKESFYEYLIRTLGEFEKVRDIDDTAIGSSESEEESPGLAGGADSRGKISKEKRLIYLKDVATITDGVKERTSYSRFNGKENISISVQKQALGNTVRIIDRVKKRLDELKSDLPKDIDTRIVYDQSEFIRNSINGVWEAAWQGALLVIVVLFYFLRNIRTSLIVAFTIPISIMATFAMMFFTGVTINMMSLSGLAFGVGSLVDASIVVIENIYSHMQSGEDPKKAAVKGANEVSVAVAGAILTTVVVFIPLIFVVGIIGQIVKDFALTVTFSLMTSWVASMTLIPLMASRGLKILEHDPKTIAIIRNFYGRQVVKYVNSKAKYIFQTFVIFFLSLLLFIFMDKELMPKVDQGQFTVKIDMPAGTRLEVTNSVAEKAEKFFLTIPEVEAVNTTVGSTKDAAIKNIVERLNYNQSEIVVNLKKKRKLKSSDVVQIIKERLGGMNLEGARIEYSLQENVLAAGMAVQAPVTVEMKGNDLKVLESLTHEVQDGLSRISGIYGIKNNLSEPSPETKVYVDKDRAAAYGLSVSDIAQVSLISVKGSVASKFKDKGEEYDIKVRLREKDRKDFNDLSRVEIKAPSGAYVQLSSVATFGKGKGPSEIIRTNQERTVLAYANIYDRALKDVTADVNNMIAGLQIPKNYSVKLAGESEEMKASFDSLRNAIIAALLLVYMIMAALFESLWQPFVVMFSIPLSLIGVAWGLFLTHTSVSAYVLIGVGILGGIDVAHTVVLIDCINLYVSRGMSVKDAAAAASKSRIRPILMTAFATILGLMPMAFLGGEGAELRAPMAITVMAGLTVATFRTLTFIPAVYVTVIEIGGKIFKKSGK
jgi:HAE1 family hydrophobic/amphiphilic exporter-1